MPTRLRPRVKNQRKPDANYGALREKSSLSMPNVFLSYVAARNESAHTLRAVQQNNSRASCKLGKKEKAGASRHNLSHARHYSNSAGSVISVDSILGF